jgi:hypothetical protein
MALDFPSSPALNDTYTKSGKTWVWNGSGWVVQPVTLTSGAITAALGYTPLSVSGGALQGNVSNTATGFFDLPAGTTEQRPNTPDSGMVRFNTSLVQFEGYSGTEWGALGGVSDGDKGDITVSSSGTTWTIDDDAVTYAKLQNINSARLLGRSTAGSGNAEEISIGSGLSLSSGTLSATGGGGGQTYTFSSTAPSSPAAGDEWLDNTSGILYTYVNDGNSSAWVELGSSPAIGAAGATGPQGATGATGSSSPKSATIAYPAAGEKFPLYFTDTALTFTRIQSLVGASGQSVQFSVRFSANFSETGTEVVSGGITANSVTGVSTTSFTNASIPANRYIWLVVNSTSGSPTLFGVSLFF